MSSTIVTRVINAANDNVISMNNSSWARPISLPANWSKVRLGFRAHFGPNVAITNQTWAMGLCSGTTALVGDYNTTNFVGVISYQGMNNSGGQVRGACKAATKVGTTLTLGTALLTDMFGPAGAVTDNNLEMFFVDITKGSPNYTVAQFGPNNNGGIAACTQAQYLTQVISAVPAFLDHGLTGGVTIAASETPGAFNAICAWWDNPNMLFEITDLAVVLLA